MTGIMSALHENNKHNDNATWPTITSYCVQITLCSYITVCRMFYGSFHMRYYVLVGQLVFRVYAVTAYTNVFIYVSLHKAIAGTWLSQIPGSLQWHF